MKRIFYFVSIFILLCTSYSCGSIVNGLASLYGNDNYNPNVTPGGGDYNPYSNFWNNASTSTTSLPAALDPNTAADAAYKSTMNNMTSGFWENAAKDEQQRKQMVDAVAKDVWEHPENYQNVPVQSGSGIGSSAGGGTVSGSNSSSGVSGQQCRVCGGTGQKIRLIHPGDATQTKWCSECNKTVGTGHFHTQCDNCRGTGKIK